MDHEIAHYHEAMDGRKAEFAVFVGDGLVLGLFVPPFPKILARENRLGNWFPLVNHPPLDGREQAYFCL